MRARSSSKLTFRIMVRGELEFGYCVAGEKEWKAKPPSAGRAPTHSATGIQSTNLSKRVKKTDDSFVTERKIKVVLFSSQSTEFQLLNTIYGDLLEKLTQYIVGLCLFMISPYNRIRRPESDYSHAETRPGQSEKSAGPPHPALLTSLVQLDRRVQRSSSSPTSRAEAFWYSVTRPSKKFCSFLMSIISASHGKGFWIPGWSGLSPQPSRRRSAM